MAHEHKAPPLATKLLLESMPLDGSYHLKNAITCRRHADAKLLLHWWVGQWIVFNTRKLNLKGHRQSQPGRGMPRQKFEELASRKFEDIPLSLGLVAE